MSNLKQRSKKRFHAFEIHQSHIGGSIFHAR